MTITNEYERVGLKFSSASIEQVFQEILRERYPFEIVGNEIIILPRSVAERFKEQFSSECKEIEIIPLFHLPREEANRIRKQHFSHLQPEGRKRTNKKDLINEVSKKTGLTKKDTKNVIDAVIKSITDALVKREKVTLVGFGTFKVVSRRTRRRVNPKTGESIITQAKKVPKFKVGKKLKGAVE